MKRSEYEALATLLLAVDYLIESVATGLDTKIARALLNSARQQVLEIGVEEIGVEEVVGEREKDA